MFSNAYRPDPSFVEGYVIQVDPIRLGCTVRTTDGRDITSVQWLQPHGGSTRDGDRFVPGMGDRAVISTALGFPIIIGFLPKLQVVGEGFPITIDNGASLVDTGNYSAGGEGAWGDMNKPPDGLVGDRTLSTLGGGFVGLLKAGTVIVRSSRLAQIVTSKLDDLVRIVSRNWEHFTDAGTEVIRNIKGRIFRYVGYTNNAAESQMELYKFHEYYGDTSLAETVKADSLSLPNPLPAKNDILYKQQVTQYTTGNPYVEVMRKTLSEQGHEEKFITGGGGHTRRVSTPSQLSLSWSDENTVTINEPVIRLERSDGAIITMRPEGIFCEYMTHYVNITEKGVQMG